jgi:hypothetical protein
MATHHTILNNDSILEINLKPELYNARWTLSKKILLTTTISENHHLCRSAKSAVMYIAAGPYQAVR